MTLECAWCQKEIKVASESPFQGYSDAQAICADCIIPMLPRSLTSHDSLSPEASEEQRRSQRVPLISQIYLTSKAKQHQITPALIIDMSDSGMKIKIGPPLERGETITLGFLGRNMIYKAIGEVARVQPAIDKTTPLLEVGIRLTGIHQDLR